MQRTALVIDEVNSRIYVTMNLGDAWLKLADQTLALEQATYQPPALRATPKNDTNTYIGRLRGVKIEEVAGRLYW